MSALLITTRRCSPIDESMPLKDFIPPIVARMGARLRSSGYGWSGNYASWEEARNLTQGYDNQAILQKVSEAVEQVKSGKAVYERDAVLFQEIQYSWPALSGFLWWAAQQQGRLRLMDFGGSLGSSYFQNRKFLAALPDVAWGVVEQPSFVEEGNRKFRDDRLSFHKDMEACVQAISPDVFLFSCVLQYLESPYGTLQKALALQPQLVVVDNMPFVDGSQRLTIQRVPPEIYTASYPCWILNRDSFRRSFQRDYDEIAHFVSPLSILLDGRPLPYEGFIFRKKASA